MQNNEQQLRLTVFLTTAELFGKVATVKEHEKAALDDVIRAVVRYQAGYTNIMDLQSDLTKLGLAELIDWTKGRKLN